MRLKEIMPRARGLGWRARAGAWRALRWGAPKAGRFFESSVGRWLWIAAGLAALAYVWGAAALMEAGLVERGVGWLPPKESLPSAGEPDPSEMWAMSVGVALTAAIGELLFVILRQLAGAPLRQAWSQSERGEARAMERAEALREARLLAAAIKKAGVKRGGGSGRL